MSYRNNNQPDNFNNNIGFRLVVAPDFQAVGVWSLPAKLSLYGAQPGKKDSAVRSRSRVVV